MAAHRFKSGFGQCECLWCGRRRDGRECAVTDAIRWALAEYAFKHGRTWKSQLREAWSKGRAEQALQAFRNVAGPSQLAKITPGMLDDARRLEREARRLSEALRASRERPAGSAQSEK